ncbi:hypothetical protein L7F22_043260 [Adiantum nelumboides]|nr:hypothetical protein [Adiantum nelumboides]
MAMIISSFKKLLSDNVKIEEGSPSGKWSLPKVSTSQIYKHHKVFALSANTLYHETHGKLTIKDSDSDNHIIHLFEELSEFKNRALRKGHQFVHIGYIAVGIVPLFRKGLNVSCIGALLDTRHGNLQDQTISILQGSVSNGPIYIECFPNFPCSLIDRYFDEIMSLLIKTHGLDLKHSSDHLQIAYRMIVRTINTCLPSVYNSGYLKDEASQAKGQNIVTKVDDTTQGTLPEMVNWQEVEFPSEWKLNISKTLLNEVQQPVPLNIQRLGSTDQYKVLGKSTSKKEIGSVMARPVYTLDRSASCASSHPSTSTSSRRSHPPALACIHPETYKDYEGLFRCKLCNKIIASEFVSNGIDLLTEAAIAKKETVHSQPYIVPPQNGRLQPLESTSNWHTNAFKEIAALQYQTLSQLSLLQSRTNFSWEECKDKGKAKAEDSQAKGNATMDENQAALKQVLRTIRPEDIEWTVFQDDECVEYEEEELDELDIFLPQIFPAPDDSSDDNSEINFEEEVRIVNPVKMETDEIKIETPSSSSSTSLKGVTKIGDMTILDIDGLDQDQVWKVFEFIYNFAHYGILYKELTQRQSVSMLIAGFQEMLQAWWDDLNPNSKAYIMQGGPYGQENFDNVISLSFAALVMQFLGSTNKIQERNKEAFFRSKLCDLTQIKKYQQHMTHLMYQFPGGYFNAEYKQYYVNSFPEAFANLVKERIKAAGLHIDENLTLTQINSFIDEVTDLECARIRMKKEIKQHHDIPIAEYTIYDEEEIDDSSSTDSSSKTDFELEFSSDNSQPRLNNMVRRPYSFPKQKRRNPSPTTSTLSSGSSDTESWKDRRTPLKLNLSKKEQQHYAPLPLFRNMVDQANAIAQGEEWKQYMHPGLRTQQTPRAAAAIPTPVARPTQASTSRTPQVLQEAVDYIQVCSKNDTAILTALQQVTDTCKQLSQQLISVQSQLAAVEAKMDHVAGSVQYLYDQAALAQVATEPMSEWVPERTLNACSVIRFNPKYNHAFFSELWIKIPQHASFRLDALWDSGSVISYINETLVPAHLTQILAEGITVSYANNSKGQIYRTITCKIAIGHAMMQVNLYLHPHPNTDLTIGADIISQLTPFTILHDSSLQFYLEDQLYTVLTKPRGTLLVGGVIPTLPNPQKDQRFLDWFAEEKAKHRKELEEITV